MNNLREVGASRVRRMPPPQLLDDIRTAGRHRLRVAAASGVVASILLSIGIAVGVTGVARAGGGDRLTPTVHAPSPSQAPNGHPRSTGVTIDSGPVARPGSTPQPITQPSGASSPSDAIVAVPPAAPGATAATPDSPSSSSPSPSGAPVGWMDHTAVHRGLGACDVRTTPSGFCGRVTTTQSSDAVTIVTEVCWSNGNTSDGALSFDSNLETDVVVSYGGQTVWDWAQDKSFSSGGESLSLAPGDCWDWTTQWAPDSGAPTGTYDVKGRNYASQLASGPNAWSAAFTVG
jgi:hypothetical protein